MFQYKTKKKYKTESLRNSSKKQITLLGNTRPHSSKNIRMTRSESTIDIFYSTYSLLWALFFCVVVYIFIFSPVLKISHIHIEGNDTVSSSDIEQFIQSSFSQYKRYIIPGDAFLFFIPSEFENNIETEFKKIQSVTIKKTFPNRIDVYIQERKVLFLWCVDSQCYYVNENGYAYAPVTSFNAEKIGKFLKVSDLSMQEITPEIPILDSEALVFALNIQEQLERQVGIIINNDCVTHSRFSDEFIFTTSEGWELRINTRIPLDKSLSSLKLLLEKEISKERREHLKYTDLRTENKAYYSIDGESMPRSSDTVKEDKRENNITSESVKTKK